MRRNGMCPMCYFKNLFFGAKRVSEAPNKPYENGARKTPIMGWSSWNTFKNRIDEELIYQTALAMKESGLKDAGYEYVNIDDCWQSSMRDENGNWLSDMTTFAHGIPALCEKINALGLKLGMYSSNGTLTCEDLPASLNREYQDALTLAHWGVEYFKYDFCHNVRIPSYAPLVYGIAVSKKGERESKRILCSNGILGGLARFMRCGKVDGGRYVSGLDAGKGSLTFDNVTADSDGEYALTVLVKKKGQYEKYLVCEVNGRDRYEIEIPPQKHYNVTARFQTSIRLKAGVNSVKLFNPVADKKDSAAIQYRRMASALSRASEKVAAESGKPIKPIVFSICEWGFRKPWLWGASAGNMWRTTPDIRPVWNWIKVIYERTVKLYPYSSAGHFNDPDMLEVGNGKLTYEENLSHFTLWCFMNAPLVLGNDLRSIEKPVLDIVTNKGLIAINQDALCKQAKRVKKGGVDVLAKPLADGSTAICFFNKGGKRGFSFDLSSLYKDNYVAAKKEFSVIENVTGETALFGKTAKTTLGRHGSAAFIIR